MQTFDNISRYIGSALTLSPKSEVLLLWLFNKLTLLIHNVQVNSWLRASIAYSLPFFFVLFLFSCRVARTISYSKDI